MARVNGERLDSCPCNGAVQEADGSIDIQIEPATGPVTLVHLRGTVQQGCGLLGHLAGTRTPHREQLQNSPSFIEAASTRLLGDAAKEKDGTARQIALPEVFRGAKVHLLAFSLHTLWGVG